MTPIGRAEQIERESERLRRLQTKSDAIGCLILHTDLPWVDIAIRIEDLRREAAGMFPAKEWLFDLIYVSRFRRLWTQWRDPT